MKKLLSLLLALVLVFSLVACGNKATETSKETKSESTSETTVESKVETEVETKDGDASKDATFLSLAVKDNLVIANEGENQGLYKLNAKNESSLLQGFKYEFKYDASKLTAGEEVATIEVDKADILGKQIGFDVKPEVAQKLVKSVEGVVVIDTRAKEDFAKGHLKGAINLSADAIEKIGAEGTKLEDLGLGSVKKDSVVLIFGDSATNKTLASTLYEVIAGNVYLDAGSLENYKGELVTE